MQQLHHGRDDKQADQRGGMAGDAAQQTIDGKHRRGHGAHSAGRPHHDQQTGGPAHGGFHALAAVFNRGIKIGPDGSGQQRPLGLG